MSLLGDSEDVIPDQNQMSCLLRSHEVPITTASASPVGQSPSVDLNLIIIIKIIITKIDSSLKKKNEIFHLIFLIFNIVMLN